jgi:hypothetical protein
VALSGSRSCGGAVTSKILPDGTYTLQSNACRRYLGHNLTMTDFLDAGQKWLVRNKGSDSNNIITIQNLLTKELLDADIPTCTLATPGCDQVESPAKWSAKNLGGKYFSLQRLASPCYLNDNVETTTTTMGLSVNVCADTG